ncbi:MAG: ABC transporter substrate-binding protein [Thermodesulfobacteriota bacterium]|nr:ABC transporter substrate-binding protein [Thermodesulfobacteriota bacterium]
MKTIVRVIFMVLAAVLLIAPACEREKSHTGPAEKEVPGVTNSEILIGSSLALSGHAGYLGTQTLRGAMSYINHVNERGGVHGRKIKIISYDDQYDPPLCVGNTHKLIVDHGVFALFCYVGTPTIVKIIPLVNKANIPLLGMFTGANALREPMSRYIINVRASYYQETEEAVRRFVKNLGLSRIAVFYQYDAYGFDGLKGTELALKKFGLVPVATGTYIRGTLDVKEGLKKIAASEAEAVVMIGTYEPCAEFINLALEKGFSPVFYNVSFVGAEELARRLGGRGENVFVTQVVPPPQSPESRTLLWGSGEYIDLLEKYFPDEKPNAVGLEGYINARVLVEGLRRAGLNLNRERFIDAVESIRNFSLGIANTLSFGPRDHQGFERVYFTQFKDGRFRLVTDWGMVKEDLRTQTRQDLDASE